VDDLDERGNPRGPGSAPPSSTDKAHWTIRIRHKDPRQNAVKEHNSVVLRAETFQAKVEWLARLRKASGEIKPKPAPAKVGDERRAGPGMAIRVVRRHTRGSREGGQRGGRGPNVRHPRHAAQTLSSRRATPQRAARAEPLAVAAGEGSAMT
jgi:hypothetical protein